MRFMSRGLVFVSLWFGCPVLSVADEGPTAWDLTHMFDDDAAWETSRASLAARLGALDLYRGRLGEKGAILAEAIEVYFELDKAYARLYGYASMRADGDISAPGPQGMEQAMRGLGSDLSASTAWFEPEILAIAEKKLAKFQEKTPELVPYTRYLQRLQDRRPHVLDARGEKLLGMASRLMGTGGNMSGVLRNAEIRWPTVTTSSGDAIKVTPTGYSRGRVLESQDDRAAIFQAFYGELDHYEGSFAAALSATVEEHVFLSRARGYDSSLEASLGRNEVDPAVYEMLVTEIGNGLPVLHRYLDLRRRMMGLDELHYHDMYPSLVEGIAESYDWSRSRVLVADALQILGQDYVDRLESACDEGWVDVYPSEGKRSGAYVTGAAYDVHPYMLLNHTDDYLSLSTYAHEAGHLMHSAFTQEVQPYQTSDYATFVAEVASTVNEVILFENLLAKEQDAQARIALLGHFLEGLRTTVFRQTMFAEFERDVHAAAEAGQPLSADRLDAMYGDLLRRYHGEAQGVTTIDPLYEAEWSYIPHFHYDFYVYQYATSYVAAISLAKGILQARPGAVEAYRAFLRSGSTKDPVSLLKDAGVDMTSPQPIRDALEYMDEVITRIEAETAALPRLETDDEIDETVNP
jgi:oligoendopeptidase F